MTQPALLGDALVDESCSYQHHPRLHHLRRSTRGRKQANGAGVQAHVLKLSARLESNRRACLRRGLQQSLIEALAGEHPAPG